MVLPSKDTIWILRVDLSPPFFVTSNTLSEEPGRVRTRGFDRICWATGYGGMVPESTTKQVFSLCQPPVLEVTVEREGRIGERAKKIAEKGIRLKIRLVIGTFAITY